MGATNAATVRFLVLRTVQQQVSKGGAILLGVRGGHSNLAQLCVKVFFQHNPLESVLLLEADAEHSLT